ncbi:MAG: Maf family protein [Fimbriimonas sp.]
MLLSRPVILASASPRRHELLRQLVEEFEIVVAGVDEDALTCPDPWETAQRLALAKARAVAEGRPDALVIGGDTVVALALDGGYQQLTKPVDAEDAVRILSLLSGREHVVITGVALVWAEGSLVGFDTTRVRFRSLLEAEIREYVATGEPMDKAGAYGIQGLGGTIVESFEGSISNVVGLPLERLGELLNLVG